MSGKSILGSTPAAETPPLKVLLAGALALFVLVLLFGASQPATANGPESIDEQKFETRIVGGFTARQGTWPGIVRIYNRPRMAVCSGQLINSRWVLTAAHCLDKTGTLRITVNRYDTNSKQGIEMNVAHFGGGFIPEAGNFSKRASAQVFLHPRWDPYRKGHVGAYDLALLRLPRKVPGEYRYLSTIRPKSGERLSLAGYGVLSFNSASSAAELQESSMLAFDCREAGSPNPEKRICTRDPGTSICAGDSGGPLISNGRLVGIASATYDRQCRPGAANLYASVPDSIDWIRQTMRRGWQRPKIYRIYSRNIGTDEALSGFKPGWALAVASSQFPFGFGKCPGKTILCTITKAQLSSTTCISYKGDKSCGKTLWLDNSETGKVIGADTGSIPMVFPKKRCISGKLTVKFLAGRLITITKPFRVCPQRPKN
jgi:trypsin